MTSRIFLFPIVLLVLCLAQVSSNVFVSYSQAELTKLETTQRIINGNVASNGEYPYAVALTVAGFPSSAGQFCGGSLIDAEWVLTAAHCVTDEGTTIVNNPSLIEVVTGRNNINLAGGTVSQITQITIHPSYNPVTFENDIALLKLSAPVVYTPIKVATTAIDAGVAAGELATVIGWGATMYNQFTEEASSPSALLLEVDLPIVSNATCLSVYGSGITSNMLCAGFDIGGRDSCSGDSGGPFIVEESGVDYQIGVVSFGSGCALAGVPGVYTRVANYFDWIESTAEIDLDPGSGGGILNCTPDTGGFPVLPGSDNDGDGVSDADEIADGTSSSDPGVFLQHLDSPVYALWTGFLDIVPIAELVNTSASPMTARVSLYRLDGSLGSIFTTNIEAGNQKDIILSSMSGFTKDSYGLIKIEHCDGMLDGRISYYRSTVSSDFEFAYSIPLVQPTFGNSAVSFNTFQPTRNVFEVSDLVSNWLSLVNLSDVSQVFTVNRYSLSGELASPSRVVTVTPGARVDIEAGHVDPGPSNVGLLEIIPQDSTRGYHAMLKRFGHRSTGFNFAFPLIAKSSSGFPQYATLTTTANSQNWLELINPNSISASASIIFGRNDGSVAGNVSLTLDAFSQQHFNVNGIIGDNQVGYVEIFITAGSLLAQSMVYTFDPVTGSMLNMYGSQAKRLVATRMSGSFNLFLNMSNYLKVINPSNSVVNFNVSAQNLTINSTNSFSLDPFNTIDIPINNTLFGVPQNTLGQVVVETTGAQGLVSELIRLRGSSVSSNINYIFPTEVRLTK